MPRPRGTTTGATRSMRLPVALDEWLEARMRAHPHRSASDLLVELGEDEALVDRLVHGCLPSAKSSHVRG